MRNRTLAHDDDREIQFPIQTAELANTRDNETVVTVEISGTFPGSPISLDYHFAIASGKIASLTIDS